MEHIIINDNSSTYSFVIMWKGYILFVERKFSFIYLTPSLLEFPTFLIQRNKSQRN